MIHLLSFDVEEYFHGTAFRHIQSNNWAKLECRLLSSMEILLSILGKQKATFFVVGWIAQKYPSLIKDLHKTGHEIACHSYMHKPIWELTRREFREDISRAKTTIENIIGTDIIGFRAPVFSVTRKTYWALDIIREVGFKYDSSIFPIYHDRYGIPGSPRLPYEILDDLWEIPLSTTRLFSINIPFGGGGYFRLYPYWLTRLFIKRMEREKAPLVFYQHPWELDNANLPKPKTLCSRLRRNIGIGGKTKTKLKKLLGEYNFLPINDWLNWRAAQKISVKKLLN